MRLSKGVDNSLARNRKTGQFSDGSGRPRATTAAEDRCNYNGETRPTQQWRAKIAVTNEKRVAVKNHY